MYQYFFIINKKILNFFHKTKFFGIDTFPRSPVTEEEQGEGISSTSPYFGQQIFFLIMFEIINYNKKNKKK